MSRRGARVLLLRPGATQLADYPINFLDSGCAEQISSAAYTHTLHQLDDVSTRALLRDAGREKDQY